MNKTELLDKFLKTDPISEAEKVTGKSYKEDESTMNLGFVGHMINNHRKEIMLTEADDTTFSNKVEDYLRKLKDFGFEVVYNKPFINNQFEEHTDEVNYILFHREYSILLKFDTYWGNVNGGNFYYNWCPNDRANRFNCTSSGGYVSHTKEEMAYSWLFNPDFTPHFLPKDITKDEPEWDYANNQPHKEYDELRKLWIKRVEDYSAEHDLKAIWSGNHDCREAVKHNITKLANNGTFLKKWKEQPFLWLLTYQDTKIEGYDYKAINAEIISQLPIDIQEIIKGDDK